MSKKMMDFKHDPAQQVAPFGMYNRGQTCWFNALFQALSGSTILREMLNNAANNPPMPLSPLITSFHKFMRNGSSDDFYNEFSKFASIRGIAMGSQNCTQEAFTRFISESGVPGIDLACKMVSDYRAQCPRCDCSKEWSDYSYNIGVPVANMLRENFSLSHYIMSRRSAFDWRCEKCGTKIDNRTEYLARINNVLVLTFFQYYEKVAFNFPTEINLIGDGCPDHKFKLVSQIEHFGGLLGGHYTARSLRRGGRVYNFNDNSFTESKFGPSEFTYMLIYERA